MSSGWCPLPGCWRTLSPDSRQGRAAPRIPGSFQHPGRVQTHCLRCWLSDGRTRFLLAPAAHCSLFPRPVLGPCALMMADAVPPRGCPALPNARAPFCRICLYKEPAWGQQEAASSWASSGGHPTREPWGDGLRLRPALHQRAPQDQPLPFCELRNPAGGPGGSELCPPALGSKGPGRPLCPRTGTHS